MSINGKRGWSWVARHQDLFYYFLSDSRGRDVLKKYFAEFKGVCICDGWPPYGLFKIIQRCWAHILREAKYVWIQLETEYSKEFYDKIQKLFARITAKEITKPNRRLYNSAIKELDLILSEYECECKNEESFRTIHTKIHNAGTDLFTFLLYPGVPPTNNAAEQAMTYVVMQRKVRGCLRNETGMVTFANIMT